MNEIVVIKCGGSTLDELSDSFFKSIKDLKNAGKKPVIVHGGGPAIKKVLNALNVESEFVNGLRKTTAEVMDVVEMVLAGKVNKWIVNQLQQQGVCAVGLSGIDGGLLKAEARDFENLGFVGEVTAVNHTLISSVLENDMIPVIAPIGLGETGERFNINADSAAGAVAFQLQATQLMFVTDVPGILKDGELINECTSVEIEKLIKEGTIYGGMIPKVEAALKSLEGTLKEVMIVDGKNTTVDQHGEIIGTKIKKSLEVV